MLWLTFGLKGNGHLHRAVVTGILRVSKENLFSGLNNVGVYTLLARRYNTRFGFTEAEVLALLARIGRSEQIEAVRAWYNGYLFGGEVIYNPWSVLNYLERGEEEPQPFWLATSVWNRAVDLGFDRSAAPSLDAVADFAAPRTGRRAPERGGPGKGIPSG